jgi:hypothetical protein
MFHGFVPDSRCPSRTQPGSRQKAEDAESALYLGEIRVLIQDSRNFDTEDIVKYTEFL